MADLNVLQFLKGQGQWSALLAKCDEFLAQDLPPADKAEVLHLRGLCLVCLSEANLPSALGCLKDALEISPASDVAQRVAILGDLIAAHSAVGNYQMCQQYEKQLAGIIKKHGCPVRPLLIAMYNLAYAYDHAGRLDEAATVYQDLLQIAHDDWPAQRAANNLAHIYLRLGALEKAADAIRIARSAPAEIEPLILNNESLYALATGNAEEAYRLANQAMSHPTCDAGIRGQILLTLAQIAHVQGNRQQAVNLATEALVIGQSIPSSLVVARSAKYLKALERVS